MQQAIVVLFKYRPFHSKTIRLKERMTVGMTEGCWNSDIHKKTCHQGNKISPDRLIWNDPLSYHIPHRLFCILVNLATPKQKK